MSDQAPIFGIDLGTTYSCIAVVGELDRPEVIQNSEGLSTTPSVVFFESETNVVVGRVAKANAKLTPKLVCSTVKRQIGQDDFRFAAQGKAYRAEEVSALILKKVVGDALESRGEPREASAKIVVTVPAYFGSNERAATQAAGRMAGYEVVSIVDEPVAAAFAYGLSRAKTSQHVLVYDLGGGTFDVTVVRVDGTSAICVATDGVRLLGGADWDERIATFANDRFLAEHGSAEGAPIDDPEVAQRLAIEAEDAKITLSQRQKASFLVTYAGKQTQVEISREDFEQRTADLLEKTIEVTLKTIEEAKTLGVERIDKLLLVGGSSKMPAVKTRLKAGLGMDGDLFRPDQSVAEGAALVGEMIRKGEYSPTPSPGNGRGLPSGRLGFVCAKSLGIVAVRKERPDEEYVEYIIRRNSPLPVSVTEVFGTIVAGQPVVKMEVKEQRESESELLNDNETIHEEPLKLPRGLPANAPIEVTFSLGLDGVLQVHALERSSGRKIEARIQRDGILTEEEIEEKTQALQRLAVS